MLKGEHTYFLVNPEIHLDAKARGRLKDSPVEPHLRNDYPTDPQLLANFFQRFPRLAELCHQFLYRNIGVRFTDLCLNPFHEPVCCDAPHCLIRTELSRSKKYW